MPTVHEALMYAMSCHQAGRLQEAERVYRHVLSAEPASFDAWHLLGVISCQTGRLDDGIACISRALQLAPGALDAINNLGNACKERGRLDDAVATFGRLIELNPADADAHYSLGTVLQLQRKLSQAADSYRRAVALRPEFAEAHNNLGTVLTNQHHFAEAASCFQKALALNPNCREWHMNLASLYLRQGDFDRGLEEFEWRWPAGASAALSDSKLWDGRSLAGRRIVLHPEQGLGDTLQFVRYAPLLKQQGATVVLECQPPLRPLLSQLAVDRLIDKRADWPPFDWHAPLMSLPRIVKTRLSTVPAEVPYLSADPALVARWRAKLSHISGCKIAIAWQGNPAFPEDCDRSFPLALFEVLARTPGVTLISLQKGVGTDQLAADCGRIPVLDFSDELDASAGAFMDSAAIMNNVDLVITSDSALAHLAGALGVQVWLPLSFVPHWRWLLGRSDCPWYPSMRLFRQRQPGDWAGVFAEIHAELPSLLNKSN